MTTEKTMPEATERKRRSIKLLRRTAKQTGRVVVTQRELEAALSASPLRDKLIIGGFAAAAIVLALAAFGVPVPPAIVELAQMIVAAQGAPQTGGVE